MFGDKIKELRRKNGLTQVEFAKIFCIATGTIGMWETKKREPDFEMVTKTADYFDVYTDYLLGRENTQKITRLSLEDKRVLELVRKNPELGGILTDIFDTISNFSHEEAQTLIAFLKARRNSE